LPLDLFSALRVNNTVNVDALATIFTKLFGRFGWSGLADFWVSPVDSFIFHIPFSSLFYRPLAVGSINTILLLDSRSVWQLWVGVPYHKHSPIIRSFPTKQSLSI